MENKSSNLDYSVHNDPATEIQKAQIEQDILGLIKGQEKEFAQIVETIKELKQKANNDFVSVSDFVNELRYVIDTKLYSNLDVHSPEKVAIHGRLTTYINSVTFNEEGYAKLDELYKELDKDFDLQEELNKGREIAKEAGSTYQNTFAVVSQEHMERVLRGENVDEVIAEIQKPESIENKSIVVQADNKDEKTIAQDIANGKVEQPEFQVQIENQLARQQEQEQEERNVPRLKI